MQDGRREQGSGAGNALVLGGGGPLGAAWEAGMLQGWFEEWAARRSGSPTLLEMLGARRVIGTSAGAIVGAHLAAHGNVTRLVTEEGELRAPRGPSMGRFFWALFQARLLSRSVQGLRRSMGRSALRMALPGEPEWLEMMERWYTPPGPWPATQELLLTAVDAETGAFEAWNADAGVPLARAIAASCAVPCVFPLVHVNGRSYMDGGIPSPTNAELAKGCERVVVLDPLGRVMGKTAPVERERRALEQAGSRTAGLAPDRATAEAIGRHWMDASRARRVAELGLAQGRATAAGVAGFLGTQARNHPS